MRTLGVIFLVLGIAGLVVGIGANLTDSGSWLAQIISRAWPAWAAAVVVGLLLLVLGSAYGAPWAQGGRPQERVAAPGAEAPPIRPRRRRVRRLNRNRTLAYIFLVSAVISGLIGLTQSKVGVYSILFLITYALARLGWVFLQEQRVIRNMREFRPPQGETTTSTRERICWGRQQYWQRARRLIIFDYLAIFALITWLMWILNHIFGKGV